MGNKTHWGSCADCTPLNDKSVDRFIKKLADIYDMRTMPADRERMRQELRRQLSQLNESGRQHDERH